MEGAAGCPFPTGQPRGGIPLIGASPEPHAQGVESGSRLRETRVAAPAIINGAVAFVTGIISMYSSTSGVVLPAFLPTVPGLVERVGGGDPLAVALSINVGSSLVDVSPLSTLGALCLAALPAGEDARALFKKLFVWGLAMTVVGAVISQLFMGAIAQS